MLRGKGDVWKMHVEESLNTYHFYAWGFNGNETVALKQNLQGLFLVSNSFELLFMERCFLETRSLSALVIGFMQLC